MPWFVVLSVPANDPNGIITASVVEYPTEAAFTKATNIIPAKSGPNQDEFTTKAAAQAAANAYNGKPASQKNLGSPGPAPAGASAVNTPGFTLPNPFGDVASALSAFYAQVTKASMWKSLGWVLLGILIMLIGILLWTGPGALKASPYGRALGAIKPTRA